MGEGLLIFHRSRLRKAGGGRKAVLVLAIALGLFIWFFLAIEKAVVPTLVAISQTEVARVANQVINEAVSENIESFLSGKSLLEFKTGPTGEILYVQTNTPAINQIQFEALSVLQNAVNNLAGFKVYVPLGQMFGSRVFAPVGPKIPVTVYPYGTVRAQVLDSYDVTGINQTRFEISLRVTCMIRVVIPLIESKTELTSDVPLTTVLIPGKVPDTYLDLNK